MSAWPWTFAQRELPPADALVRYGIASETSNDVAEYPPGTGDRVRQLLASRVAPLLVWRLDGGECICPVCGLRHGCRPVEGDPPF